MKGVEDPGLHRGRVVVSQGSRRPPQNQPQGDALLARRHLFAAVHVQRLEGFDLGHAGRRDGLFDVGPAEGLVHDDGQVPRDGGELGQEAIGRFEPGGLDEPAEMNFRDGRGLVEFEGGGRLLRCGADHADWLVVQKDLGGLVCREVGIAVGRDEADAVGDAEALEERFEGALDVLEFRRRNRWRGRAGRPRGAGRRPGRG